MGRWERVRRDAMQPRRAGAAGSPPTESSESVSVSVELPSSLTTMVPLTEALQGGGGGGLQARVSRRRRSRDPHVPLLCPCRAPARPHAPSPLEVQVLNHDGLLLAVDGQGPEGLRRGAEDERGAGDGGARVDQ